MFSNKGFTLIELMIAMALFVTVMVVATGLFGQAINNQGKTTSQKNLQESLSYSLHFLKKEVAGAKESLLVTAPSTYCGGASASDSFFYTPTRTFQNQTVKDLYFINKNEQCVRYFLQADNSGVTRLAVTRNGLPAVPYFIYINSSDSVMTDFDIDVIELDNDSDYASAKLTIFMAAKPVGGVTAEILNLQSTITLNPFVCGQVIYDRDSFSYKTVQIGNQCWMAENLKTKTKPGGSCINSGSSYVAPGCTRIVTDVNCADGVDAGNTNECGGEKDSGRDCIKSGNVRGAENDCLAGYALYEWDAAMNGSVSEGAQGICPIGWHIPSRAEFDSLISVFGDRATAGPELKFTGSSGFNDILAGDREKLGEIFENRGSYGNYWLSTKHDSAQAWYIWIPNDNNEPIDDYFDLYTWNFSIRCLKD
jgi:uncharacterized protein (TIGR02145 family)/prepilin-type N-terminal cleavage/methylation domain-containing protein